MFRNAVEIFDIFGFRIRIDPSWLLIAALVVWSLSANYFPQTVSGLTRSEYISLSVITMLGLFASLVFHELSHSLVARRFGLGVGGITLFIFGGVAELEQEPRDAQSEFWIAIAGPLASLFLAGFAYFLLYLVSEDYTASSLSAVINYLGMINVVLAVFNLVPAFPLDGGRVMRAALWRQSGDLLWSTRIASRFGVAFGIILIAMGALSVFGGASIGGLWPILIGFFLMSASSGSYQQLLIKTMLRDHSLSALMTRNPVTADPEINLDELVEDIMLGRNVSFVPVVEGEHLLGYVDTDTVRKIDRENWSSTHLSDIFIPSNNSNTIGPDLQTDLLFEKMAKEGRRKFLIAEQERLLGVISLSDLMAFLAIRQGLGDPDNMRAG